MADHAAFVSLGDLMLAFGLGTDPILLLILFFLLGQLLQKA